MVQRHALMETKNKQRKKLDVLRRPLNVSHWAPNADNPHIHTTSHYNSTLANYQNKLPLRLRLPLKLEASLFVWVSNRRHSVRRSITVFNLINKFLKPTLWWSSIQRGISLNIILSGAAKTPQATPMFRNEDISFKHSRHLQNILNNQLMLTLSFSLSLNEQIASKQNPSKQPYLKANDLYI